MDVAAKTGTTDDNYDRWLCGFTNYYTAVTWYGYDLNEEISYSGHQNPASVIWANVMQSVHANLSSSSFEKPNDVVSAEICSSTGNVANSYCPNTYTEYFLRGTIPKKCSQHTSKNSSSSNEQKNTNNSTIQNTQIDNSKANNVNNTSKPITNNTVTNNNSNNTQNTNVNNNSKNIINNNNTNRNNYITSNTSKNINNENTNSRESTLNSTTSVPLNNTSTGNTLQN